MAILTGERLNELIREQSVNSTKIAIDEILDIYQDNWDDILDAMMKEQFTDKEYRKMLLLKSKEINLMKRTVNELSMIYKEPPTRQLITSDEKTIEATPKEDLKSDENYDKIMKESSLDVTMTAAEKYTNLTNHVLIKPVVRKNKLDYDMIMFNNAEVLTDEEDWKRIIAVKYYVGYVLPKEYGKIAAGDTIKIDTRSTQKSIFGTPQSKYVKAYLYTLEDYETDEGKIIGGKIYTLERKGDVELVTKTIENPYKDDEGNTILPFILTYKEYPVRKLLNFSSGNDLYDGTLGFALNLAYLNNLRKYQSFIQGYITGTSPEGLPKQMNFGPSSWLTLWDRQGTASVGTLDLQANIENFWKVMKEEAALVLAQYNIKPSNFELSAQPESGFSALMSNADKLEYRASKIPYWRKFEDEIYKVSRIVWNTDGPGDSIGEGILKVDYTEPKFPETAEEEQTRFNFYKFNNVLTSIDLIMEKNPDLTRKEAEKKIEENKEINERIEKSKRDEIDEAIEIGKIPIEDKKPFEKEKPFKRK